MPETKEKCIIFGDGTVLENSHCGYADRYLWCFINGKSMLECAEMCSDLNKTSAICGYLLGRGYRYTGFTDLLLVQKSSDGSISVRLTWPEGAPHSVEELEEPEDE